MVAAKCRVKRYWNDKNVFLFLDHLKAKYNLHSQEDWNSVTQKQIISNGGRSLFHQFSLYDIKCMACTKNNIESKLFKKFQPKPSGYWNDSNNVNQFLNKIKEKYNLNSAKDWNSINRKIIQENGGLSLLHKYSIYDLKCLGFPDGKLIYKKKHRKNGYWDNENNILQFLNEIKQKYNLNTFENWNSITYKQINASGGSRLLSKYSLYDLKCLGFPEGKFDKPNQYKSSGFWDDKNNVIQFLDEIKQKYNLNNVKDWNSITQKQIIINGGGSLFHLYSMYDLKCLGFPDGRFLFNKPPKYWNNKENINLFLDHLKVSLNLQSPEDWNSITQKQIKNYGASSLLSKYSLYDLKCMACPTNHEKFEKPHETKSSTHWNNEENRNQFIENLKQKFNLKTPQDWKRLSKRQIFLQGGSWLYYKDKEYLKKINIFFDNSNSEQISYSLQELLYSKNLSKRSSQRWLFLQVQKLFPGEEIVEDYFHPELSRESGFSVQFDIFLTQKKLAFEYHGQQHYEDLPTTFVPLEMHQNRDIEKKSLCMKYGIKLIIIPYWWNNKLDSLRETVNASLS